MPSEIQAWLSRRSRDELVDLVAGLVSDVEGAGEWLTLQQLRDEPDAMALKAEVNGVLSVGGRHRSYYGAIEYARDAQGILDVLEDAAQTPTVELLPIVERALTLVTRAVLHADDSAGSRLHAARRACDRGARSCRHPEREATSPHR